jgi:hypothetical protein
MKAWWEDVEPLIEPCSICGATAYTVVDNRPRCPDHLTTDDEPEEVTTVEG